MSSSRGFIKAQKHRKKLEIWNWTKNRDKEVKSAKTNKTSPHSCLVELTASVVLPNPGHSSKSSRAISITRGAAVSITQTGIMCPCSGNCGNTIISSGCYQKRRTRELWALINVCYSPSRYDSNDPPRDCCACLYVREINLQKEPKPHVNLIQLLAKMALSWWSQISFHVYIKRLQVVKS